MQHQTRVDSYGTANQLHAFGAFHITPLYIYQYLILEAIFHPFLYTVYYSL